MNAELEMQQLKGRIAEVYARREDLKKALETGALGPRVGFPRLEATDRELSDLDARYKVLWDAAHPRLAPHPAASWARDTVFEPIQLDCVTTIMLKILDGKCKMGTAEKDALTAVYDVVRQRPGRGLGAEIHALIAAARLAPDAGSAAAIHAWRVRAEAAIPKPAMKAFKHWLRTALAMDSPPNQEETR